MSEEYTVPALRDQADRMRKQAEEVMAGAQAKANQIIAGGQDEADKLRRAAAEIDKLADGQMGADPLPSSAPPCQSCGLPLVHDELGWRHAYEMADRDCPGPTPPVPAPPTAPFDAVPVVTRTDGEVAGNA